MSSESTLKSSQCLESNNLSDSESNDLLNQFEEETYSESTKLSFPELLRVHPKLSVWGFKYGQNVRENAMARDKTLQESSEKRRESESESCNGKQFFFCSLVYKRCSRLDLACYNSLTCKNSSTLEPIKNLLSLF